MSNNPKYYVVDAAALPAVFIKVAEAKRLLDMGSAATVGAAAKAVGISRSAFYKYKDYILPFENLMAGRIITFQMTLHDEPGVLSCILSIFAQYGANILTINQTIPTNSCAAVTVTTQTNSMTGSLEALLLALQATDGVVRAEILGG